MTFPAWSTFLTGTNPGKHGIFDFTEHLPDRMGVRFINSSRRKYPTFLKLLSDAGCRVGSIGIPTTYPPESLNGFQISGFDTPLPSKADSSYVKPPELAELLQQRLGGYSFGDFNESNIDDEWHERVLRQLREGIERKIEVAKLLIDEYDPELLTVHVGETDTVGHHFWALCDPDSPRYIGASTPEISDAIHQVYRWADNLVGTLLEKSNPDLILIVSDHGMGGTSDRILYLNRYLEQMKFLKFNGNTRVSGFMEPLKKYGMKWLPYRWQQQVFRFAGGKLASNIESMQRFSGINWQETSAYSEELNYYPSIWLNIQGRDPLGSLIASDIAKVTDLLRDALLAWRDPADNNPVVKAIHSRESLYHGSEIKFAPDLILELNRPDGFDYALGKSLSPHGSNPWRRLQPDEYLGYKGATMNGSHRQYGTLIINGTNLATDLAILDPSLEDIAPTLLDCLNLAKPDWMDGKSLLSERQSETSAPPNVQSEISYSELQQESIRKNLSSLGYLG